MKVHVVLKRQKSAIFYVAAEIDTVLVLKKFVAKIFNVDLVNLRLTYFDRELYNTVRLFEYGISPKIALPHNPAVIGIQLRRSENDKFERLVIVNTNTQGKQSTSEPFKTSHSKKNSKGSIQENDVKSPEDQVDDTQKSLSSTNTNESNKSGNEVVAESNAETAAGSKSSGVTNDQLNINDTSTNSSTVTANDDNNATDSTNNATDSTNNATDSTNNATDSTNNATDSTNNVDDSTNVDDNNGNDADDELSPDTPEKENDNQPDDQLPDQN